MHWMLNEPQKWLTCSNLVITEKVTFPIKNRLENVNRLGCSSSPQIELIKKILALQWKSGSNLYHYYDE